MSLLLEERSAALEAALDAGDGRLPPELVEHARELVVRVRERVGLSSRHTVVALAGATGSGKSSVLNALVGADLAETGVQRPTTAHALAVVVTSPTDPGSAATTGGAGRAAGGPHDEQPGRPGTRVDGRRDVRHDAPDGGAALLLDWLEVGRRHTLVASDEAAVRPRRRPGRRAHAVHADLVPPDLVLLDLPDHDSVVVEHRVRAERLVERADLLVWVVDPQKYADAALHERYLRTLVGHDDVVVLALNQADRLSPAETDAVLADLRRLAALDGLSRARTLAVSARTGEGIAELRGLVALAVERREATTQRFGADLRAVADEVVRACGRPAPGRVRAAADELVDALEDAAGVPTVVEAVRRSAARRARARTGWPPVRWLARLRPDPLRRLHLASRELAPRDARQAELTRTSLPQAGPGQRARVATAVREHVRGALAGAPDAWVLAARDQLDLAALPEALDRAVAGTPLLPERPVWWWRVLAALQWVLLAAALVGALWLGGLALAAYLQLDGPGTPVWGPAPAPTVLLVGGVLAGVLLAGLGALAGRLGARRRARAAGRRLRAAVRDVARRLVVDPLAVQSDALERCRREAARAAAR
ncbi:GTPase [Cellulomonas persica]|uniref:Uncharacterized protein n=1 Tax=Cellulomonas persica TaxID=76861 RepID=A0A510UNZ7_9CELL|nr:GTPase [Cellulomonas persica]GEK16388.1 hypothetical protein CPE01_01210 [Cellulomonas persica]